MKDLAKSILDSNTNQLAPVILRLVLGVIFIGHGWGKLFGEGNPAGFAGWLGSMGLEPSYLLAIAAGLAETLGGALLIIGLLTRVAASSLVIVMLVAIGFVHLDAGMFGKGGYEFQLLLLAGVVNILIQGAGKLSVDEMIYKKL
ncbi:MULTISPECIES: DoxX family protein [unclassified Pseudoalteromonas]|uniref:DoxX family protein n=1 Tax=unclassified Pseudoalteromonas TaxID=194690 RepID=UPI0005AA49CF|nr:MULTISPECIES: DoxX family protein [unclassified Pseudoalteromonas]